MLLGVTDNHKSRVHTLNRLCLKKVVLHSLDPRIPVVSVVDNRRKILQNVSSLRIGKGGDKFVQVMAFSAAYIDQQDILIFPT